VRAEDIVDAVSEDAANTYGDAHPATTGHKILGCRWDRCGTEDDARLQHHNQQPEVTGFHIGYSYRRLSRTMHELSTWRAILVGNHFLSEK
jgi:hypothetical protein